MGRTSRGGQSRPPSLLAFIVAVAFVFGGYYLFQGVQNFVRTGGLGVDESTQRAGIANTATAQRVTRFAPQSAMTLRPTATPLPECQNFRVSVPAGIVREAPLASATVITQFTQGTIVCVLGRETNSEWYMLDLNANTRRIDLAYMHETVIEAVNPTPTATHTLVPSATFTPEATGISPTAAAVSATPLGNPEAGLPTRAEPMQLATVTVTPAPS